MLVGWVPIAMRTGRLLCGRAMLRIQDIQDIILIEAAAGALRRGLPLAQTARDQHASSCMHGAAGTRSIRIRIT